MKKTERARASFELGVKALNDLNAGKTIRLELAPTSLGREEPSRNETLKDAVDVTATTAPSIVPVERVGSAAVDGLEARWTEKLSHHKENLLLWIFGVGVSVAVAIVLSIWGIAASYSADVKSSAEIRISSFKEEILRDIDRAQKDIDRNYERIEKLEKPMKK